MQFSIQGDSVEIDSLPSPPHPSAPAFLQSVDMEISFNRRGQELAETYSADDMAQHLIRCFGGIVLSADYTIAFEYRGQVFKGKITGVSTLDLADEQQRQVPGGQRPAFYHSMGIVMDKTDFNLIKGSDSTVKLKSSAKKARPNAILAPNFKFQDMGIGGLDTEFSEIFRRAFASRVFPPALVDKLGIQHVKGKLGIPRFYLF